MSSLFVGSTAAYAPNFQQRAVNPKTDNVYIDPITGEKTTWKPGLIFPEKEQKSNTTKVVGTVAGLAATAVLAYVFRGKLKNVDIKWVCSTDTDPFLIRFVATATSLFLFFGGNYENNLDSKSNR